MKRNKKAAAGKVITDKEGTAYSCSVCGSITGLDPRDSGAPMEILCCRKETAAPKRRRKARARTYSRA